MPPPPLEEDSFDYPDTALDAKAQEAVQTPHFRAGFWPDLHWWEDFHDDQLSAFVEQALGNHPCIKTVESRYRISQAQALESQAILFPWLTLESDITRYRQSQTGLFNVVPGVFPLSYTQPEILFNLQAEIDWWGKNLAIYKAFLGEANAASLEVDAAVLMLSSAVATSYFNLQTSYARQENARRQMENKLNYYRMLQQKQQNGLSSDILIQMAAAKWHSSQDHYSLMSQYAALEENNLHGWLAGNFQEPIKAKIVPLPEAIPLPKNISLDLLSRRPDVLAQLQLVESGNYGIKAARAAFYPNISLTGTGGLQTITPGKLFESASKYGVIGPALNLPIFQGGLLAAQFEEKIHSYNEAVYQYEETVLEAVQDVLDAIDALKISYQRQDALRLAAHARRQVYSTYDSRMKNGIASQLDVLLAEYDWLQAEDDLITNQGRALSAYVQLMKALGGGFRD